MNIPLILRYEIAFYWPWILCFVAIAFCATRWLGWLGIVVAGLLISGLVVAIEVNSVFRDMREHPDWGRDADFVFWIGVAVRLCVYNVLVVPAGIVGLLLRARRDRIRAMTKSPGA